MAKKQISIEEYIEAAEPFAQPILHFIRECVHEVHPEIKEEIKWNFPCFIYNGSILANMARFKQHVSFGFWLSHEMNDEHGVFVHGNNKGMGNFGKITSINDLPSKAILKSYLQQAIKLHDLGVKTSPSAGKIPVPENLLLLEELKKQLVAHANFLKFSPSAQSEYHDWINEAKTQATREKRISQTIEWVLEGKPRNWKYMNKWQK